MARVCVVFGRSWLAQGSLEVRCERLLESQNEKRLLIVTRRAVGLLP